MIPNIGDDTLDDNDNNILKVNTYLKQVKESFNNIAKNSIEQSISTVKERKEKILNNMVLINFKQLFEYKGDKVKVKQ